MSEASEWQDLIDSLTKTAAKNGKLNIFHAIRSDNTKRIAFILQDGELRSMLTKWMNYRLQKREKSVETSKSLRETGNHQFGLKDYPACVRTYTEAILSCPEEDAQECSLALANRSAALFQMNLFNECITDINVALERNYPSKLVAKVLLRKAKCLFKLSQDYNQILANLEVAMQDLQVSDKKKIQSEIDSLSDYSMTSDDVSNQDFQQCDDESSAQLFCGEHETLKSASSALEVRYSEEKGRYVISNRGIKAGETLFVERPSSLVVLPDYQQSRCHHCTKPVQRFPCLTCGAVWFCSEDCRETAKSYHTFECGLDAVLSSVGIAHLGLRVVLSFGLGPVLDSSPAYEVLCRLTSHTELMPAEELYQYALTAAFLTLVLEQRTNFFPSATEESVVFKVGGLIMVHICQMVSNAHAVTEVCAVDDSSERQERIATAIYPSASLMNHSCDPTVINSFVGSTLIVRAIKDVPEGGQVFNCYGPHYRRMRRSDRLESLQMQYRFTCTCPHCLDEETEDFQDVLYSFQCSCGGSLISPKTSQQLMTKCRSCLTSQPYFPQLKADLEAVSLEAKGSEAMNQGDITLAIKYLSKCVQLRRTALFKGHPDLGKTADRLAQCFSFIGNYVECEAMLRLSMICVEEQYGRWSIEMANELQKYTDVLIELLDFGKKDFAKQQHLLRLLDDALLIYRIHYGTWSLAYREAQSKKVRLVGNLETTKSVGQVQQ